MHDVAHIWHYRCMMWKKHWYTALQMYDVAKIMMFRKHDVAQGQCQNRLHL